MEQRVCSYCGNSIEPGTGMMFVKKDGTVYYFDERRCKLSLLKFGRLARKFKWTKHYPRAGHKEAQLAAMTAAAQAVTEKKGGGGRGGGGGKK